MGQREKISKRWFKTLKTPEPRSKFRDPYKNELAYSMEPGISGDSVGIYSASMLQTAEAEIPS